MTIDHTSKKSTSKLDVVSSEALVIGGGVAGMQAALDMANQGFKVHLLEKTPSLGGKMAMIDKTFPTLDCSACILTPRLSEVSRHPNIELHTYSDVISVAGRVGDFKVKIRKRARYVDEDKCSACADCVPACPVEVPNEFDQSLGFRKAIYQPFPQATPSTYTITKLGTPACREACPADVNPQGFISLMKEGRFHDALRIFRKSNPFPGVLGRVCIAFCEGECVRGELDESVSIRNLHRFLADYERKHGPDRPIEAKIDKDERIAVVGAGPAGLACGYHLVKMGYPVTVFEAQPEAGGLLRYGIPEYRLPRDILAEEIDWIAKHGVKIKTSSPVESIKSLKKEGFKAIFLATGASNSNKLGIAGEEAKGIYHASDFLERANSGKPYPLGEKVAVIGGGDAAIDSARVAIRLGAKEVTIVYRRSHVELPAIPSEVEDAREEGLNLLLLTNPIEILTSKDELRGIRCIKMKLGEPDHSGRRRPQVIRGSEFTLIVDNMIIAVGQSVTPKGLHEECDCSEWGTIKVNPLTLETNMEGVFAGGDVVLGPATAVKAVAHGKEAAISIDRFLRKVNVEADRIEERHRVRVEEVDMEKPTEPRVDMPKHGVAGRIQSYTEVELGFEQESATQEAERCLGCAICCECELCVEACTREAIDHKMQDEIIELPVGAIVLAAGYRLYDVSDYPRLGYGKFPNVIHAMEYERLINASGPTHGHLIKLSDGKLPKSIGFIQCVGARDVNRGVPECSRVCCMYGIKNAVMAKEHDPEIDVTIYYADIRAFGKGFEEFYNMAKDRFGIKFIRGRVGEVMEDRETGNLTVRVENTDEHAIQDIEHDLVVISPGIQPPWGLDVIASELGLELDETGYVPVKDELLAPVDTTIPGVFACGCVDSPKDIPDSVTAGSAAAMRATIILSQAEKKE